MGVSHSHLEQQIFLPPDLLFDECRQLGIRDLVSIAGVNRRLRRTVRKVIRTRVYGNLAKIIPHSRIPTFLATLTNTGSVIGGSIALAAINPDFLLNQSPNNVNIFTPVDTVREWQIYLNNIGFISSTETSSQLSSCNRVITFYFHHRRNGTKTVIVYEATGSSCLTPIFESGYTSQMNFLTQDHLYCMHPHLTPQLKTLQVTRRTLTRQERREEVRLLDRGMVIMASGVLQHWSPQQRPMRSSRCCTPFKTGNRGTSWTGVCINPDASPPANPLQSVAQDALVMQTGLPLSEARCLALRHQVRMAVLSSPSLLAARPRTHALLLATILLAHPITAFTPTPDLASSTALRLLDTHPVNRDGLSMFDSLDADCYD
ncbi:hypothetical protein GALMADRAFT_139899 [Galerina marginata CBS 339.88]|uniref:F-box domain-containing protein n=1 Tax=Galerina marginata (strain CBS 339.88) TaxID=685588 RepID=A0A067TAY6_GALM3|nr:hypothetical protein GALMADRAFT_139899 [Galerina marginata CBS 339.88]